MTVPDLYDPSDPGARPQVIRTAEFTARGFVYRVRCARCGPVAETDDPVESENVYLGHDLAHEIEAEHSPDDRQGEAMLTNCPTPMAAQQDPTCQGCGLPIYRLADGTWDLVYREWDNTRICWPNNAGDHQPAATDLPGGPPA
jgi:hypothetical protein